ncbi:helix-turn-helix domain-containing protein [Paraclostridium bifermentans]|uniref:helix-turn-helix domain-containing protein n=1 Tax=Paraclostridium bifermentans TaxID=1490 RepID=UPI002149E55E|nr:helix-turn-helix domain-containing protein [Paraclostridium bifermentans]MCR1875129.1 helix-turn-helix domain-containing protein [Paraclostridium bifermentans]
MTSVVSIATYKEAKERLFPPYVPLYKAVRLYSEDFLFEEYLESDSVGKFIVKFKKNNNLTLKDISNMTGFSVSHIANIIYGKKPSVNFIQNIKKLKY